MWYLLLVSALCLCLLLWEIFCASWIWLSCLPSPPQTASSHTTAKFSLSLLLWFNLPFSTASACQDLNNLFLCFHKLSNPAFSVFHVLFLGFIQHSIWQEENWFGGNRQDFDNLKDHLVAVSEVDMSNGVVVECQGRKDSNGRCWSGVGHLCIRVVREQWRENGPTN